MIDQFSFVMKVNKPLSLIDNQNTGLLVLYGTVYGKRTVEKLQHERKQLSRGRK